MTWRVIPAQVQTKNSREHLNGKEMLEFVAQCDSITLELVSHQVRVNIHSWTPLQAAHVRLGYSRCSNAA